MYGATLSARPSQAASVTRIVRPIDQMGNSGRPKYRYYEYSQYEPTAGTVPVYELQLIPPLHRMVAPLNPRISEHRNVVVDDIQENNLAPHAHVVVQATYWRPQHRLARMLSGSGQLNAKRTVSYQNVPRSSIPTKYDFASHGDDDDDLLPQEAIRQLARRHIAKIRR